MSTKARLHAVTQAEDHRRLEHRAFGDVTAALARARDEKPPPAEIADALDANWRLWRVLSVDCAAPDNRLPLALRGKIISLAMWVARYSGEVLRDGADIGPLIDVNRSMMEGLREP